ncbi:hypothetical protein Tco_1225902 [Tanacetum coccineum]
MVKKSDGGWKMCADFTDINKACPKDCYPLPEIDWKIESLSGFRLKCFLDAYKGYHQIQMAEEDEDKTAFYAGKEVFCYKKMPFGLKNAGATYQRPIRRIQDFDKLKDHCLTLKNTPYLHQRYTVYNTLVNEEEPTDFTLICHNQQEDMAYPCLHFTDNHEGLKSNTPLDCGLPPKQVTVKQPIRRIQDFDELKDHCLTLKNTLYPHQRYVVYNTLVNEEEPTGFTAIRSIQQEDTAYMCLHFTKDHEGTRSNTSYLESSIRRIQDKEGEYSGRYQTWSLL